MRVGKAQGRAAGNGSEATEPQRRPSTESAARTRKRSAQRAQAPGIVTRRAKTAQRASWSRAGRSRARRNRARRPVARPGGRPDLRTRGADDNEQSSATIEDTPQAEGFGETPDGAAMDGTVAALDAEPGRGEFGGVPMAAREARRRYAVRRTASRRAEEGGMVAGDAGPASVGRRRASAEPDARPGRAVHGGMAAPGARTARARSAAPPSATPGTAQKERPIPRRSEGPALAGGRSAAVTRRRAGPGCRAGGPCRPGSR